MDAAVPFDTTIAPSFRVLEISLIDDNGHDMRRVAVSTRSDVALTASIKRRGVLQPIAVRPVGERYELVFGHRRLRCADAAGLLRIPADVRAWTDEEMRAIQKVENMQRAAPHPIDQWCAVSDLMDAGYTIAEAADELGLNDRETRQMERLGRLHPDVLKLVEIDMPQANHLRMIANAPRKTQAVAVKGKQVSRSGDRSSVDWWSIAQRCQVARIPRTYAIFDVLAHPAMWEEDLFAQPDAEDRFTTTDVAGFMALQKEALAALAGTRPRSVIVEASPDGLPALPKGFRLISTSPGAKPKRTESVFLAVHPSGRIVEALAVDVAAEKAAEKVRAERQAAKAKPGAAAVETGEAGDDQDDDAPVAQAEPEAKAPFSKIGLQMIADAKTRALRAALLDETATFSFSTTLMLMTLALTAKNVEVRIPWDISDHDAWQESQRRRHFLDLAGTLLQPGGQLIEPAAGGVEPVRVAMEALARLLTIDGPDAAAGNRRSMSSESGPAAEWIGAAIGAGEHLARFDTPEFLAQAKTAALKAAAQAAGIKVRGSASELRDALAGKLPDWVPEQAAFGAPAPRPG